MNSPSLENKTIRPGSLLGYSYYHSARQSRTAAAGKLPKPSIRAHYRPFWGRIFVALLILAALIFLPLLRGNSGPVPVINSNNQSSNAVTTSDSGPCAGNKLGQFILVSIKQRHFWACQGNKVLYDSPVVTGIDYLAADKTPIGTYHISAKQADQTLTGTDSTGSWSDFVQYWLPFLTNQYGTYGFHDATWRADSDFGHINPNSANASHGCVELPLSASAWLYQWVQVGTTVTIKA